MHSKRSEILFEQGHQCHVSFMTSHVADSPVNTTALSRVLIRTWFYLGSCVLRIHQDFRFHYLIGNENHRLTLKGRRETLGSHCVSFLSNRTNILNVCICHGIIPLWKVNTLRIQHTWLRGGLVYLSRKLRSQIMRTVQVQWRLNWSTEEETIDPSQDCHGVASDVIVRMRRVEL